MPKSDDPYAAFSFVIVPATGAAAAPCAGFSEVSGLNLEIAFTEYRGEHEGADGVQKVSGLRSSREVTLKNGVIRAQSLREWIGAQRDVVVQLWNESRDAVAAMWTLRAAMPRKWTAPSAAASGLVDIAIEELVLSVEAVELG